MLSKHLPQKKKAALSSSEFMAQPREPTALAYGLLSVELLCVCENVCVCVWGEVAELLTQRVIPLGAGAVAEKCQEVSRLPMGSRALSAHCGRTGELPVA